MSGVSKKNIEAIFDKVDKDFYQKDYYQKKKILKDLERKAKTFDGEEASDFIELAFDKVKYYVARIYSEGKAKSTLANLKKCIDAVEWEIDEVRNSSKSERKISMLKELLTYLEITLNLDVSFHTSLMDIYEQCVEVQQDTLHFNDIRYKYGSRGR